MPSFSNFQNEFLVAACDLSERTGQEMVEVGEIIKKYPISIKPNWIVRTLIDFTDRGLIQSTLTHDDELNQSVWLTAAGLREAEALVDTGVVILNADDLFGPEDESGLNDPFDSEAQKDAADQPVIDSTRWTGLPQSGVLNPEQIARLTKGLRLIDQAIEKHCGTNEERAQARAYLVAMDALANSPEPPADLIWQILNRANAVAGIASLFVSLIALFQAAAH